MISLELCIVSARASLNSSLEIALLLSIRCSRPVAVTLSMRFHGHTRRFTCRRRRASKVCSLEHVHACRLLLKTLVAEGAALPLAALTAAVGLYQQQKLNLPQPWTPAEKPIPLLVYGAASAVGSYVIQLAVQSNIHPLICVAGRAQAHVEKLIDRSKGDTIIDYRKGDESVVQGIKDALKGQKLEYVYDAVAELEKSSIQNSVKVLDKQSGRMTLVLPPKGGWTAKWEEIPEGVQQSMTNVGGVHQDYKDLGFVYSRFFTRGLQEGWFKAQPQEVVPGGLGGIQSALEKLKDGTASAVKYVFKVSDTEGAGSGQ